MKYGLTDKQINEITEILASYQEVEQAILFGSRAIDTFKEASDVDIAILGEKCDFLLSAKIKDHLEEETYLPFFFDIIAYNTIKSPELKNHIQTKGKVIFQRKEEWKKGSLGSLITLQRGHDLTKKNMKHGSIPVAGSNGIIGYHNTATTKGPCITIGRSGNIGSAILYKCDFWAHNTTLYVKDFKGNDKLFVYYLLKNIDFKSYNVGSAVPTLNRNHIHPILINIPPLPEQKAIAEVLSSLDDKIDLLNRQNKTLEEMAETLFRQWFIEERDEGWDDVNLGKAIQPKKGKNITKTDAIEGPYPVIAGGLSPACFHNESNTLAPVITISASGANAGYVQLHHTPVWSSDSSYIDNNITRYVYFYYVFLKINQGLIFDKQEGSAQPHIYPKHIMELEYLNVPENLILEYENIISNYFIKIKVNLKQINTLENMRDNLLPKLMSGEIKIKS